MTNNARLSTIDHLITNKLQLNSTTSGLRWQNGHVTYNFKTAGVSVDNINPDGIYSILANKSYVVGTDVDKWALNVYSNSVINVGVATADKELDNNDDSSAYGVVRVTTTADTQITLALSTDNLEVMHGSSRWYVDISHLIGQTVFSLITTTVNNTLYVSISLIGDITMYINSTGTPVLDTTKNVGLSKPLELKTNGGGVTIDGDVTATGNFIGAGGSLINDTAPALTTAYSGTKVEELVAGAGGSSHTITSLNAADILLTGTYSDIVTATRVYGMAYSPSLRMAVAYGGGNTAYRTTDGETFTSLVADLNSNWYVQWVEGQSRFIATLDGGTASKYSVDGVTWLNGGSTTTVFSCPGDWESSIEAFGKYFVNTSTTDTILLSTADGGVTWVETVVPRIDYIASFAYNEEAGILIATGSPGAGTGGPIYTTDGITWQRSGAVGQSMWSITYSPALGYFVGLADKYGLNANTVLTTTDAVTWTVHGSQPWTASSVAFITWEEDLERFVVRGGAFGTSFNYISNDGIFYKRLDISGITKGNSSIFISAWGREYMFSNTTTIAATQKRFLT